MVDDRNRWAEDEFGRLGQQFTQHLAPHTAEISKRITAVKERKHPWNVISIATVIGGAVGTFTLAGVMDILGWLSGAGAVILSVVSFGKAGQKNKALRAAQAEVDDYLYREILPLTVQQAGDYDPDILARFQQAGLIGEYDTVHECYGYTPAGEESVLPPEPVFTYTRLTRTETETYTDSQGRRQTRQRIVPVYNGILFDMPFPRSDSDARTLISTRKRGLPDGVFAREQNGKLIKMSPIKTSSLDFNKRFKVMADDQTLSHAILDPDQIMRWTYLCDDIRKEFGKHTDIFVLIMAGRMWVGIHTGELAKIDSGKTKADHLKGRMKRFARQLSTRHVMASHLKINEPPLFPWEGQPANKR